MENRILLYSIVMVCNKWLLCDCYIECTCDKCTWHPHTHTCIYRYYWTPTCTHTRVYTGTTELQLAHTHMYIQVLLNSNLHTHTCIYRYYWTPTCPWMFLVAYGISVILTVMVFLIGMNSQWYVSLLHGCFILCCSSIYWSVIRVKCEKCIRDKTGLVMLFHRCLLSLCEGWLHINQSVKSNAFSFALCWAGWSQTCQSMPWCCQTSIF